MESLTIFEAAHILGTTPDRAKDIVADRQLTSASDEVLALGHYPRRQHLDDPDSYWVAGRQAAETLEVSPQRVKQLLDK